MRRESWVKAFSEAYADLGAAVDRDIEPTIDPYAAESPAEFFAVLSEAFFESPGVVRDSYPSVYEQLVLFYRQDPAARRGQ
jgi:Mlc titration factor MtfA (ptsG expression regulator)